MSTAGTGQPVSRAATKLSKKFSFQQNKMRHVKKQEKKKKRPIYRKKEQTVRVTRCQVKQSYKYVQRTKGKYD